MNNILNNNMIIADCNIDYFYSLIVYRLHNSNPCCFQYNTIDILNITNEIFKKQLPTLKTVELLLVNPIFNSCFLYLGENKNFKANSDQYIKLIIQNKLVKSKNNLEDADLYNFVLEYVNIDNQNILKMLCSCTNNIIIDKLLDLINNCTNNLLLEPELMTVAISNLPYTKKIVISLFTKNLQITDNDYKVICKKCDVDTLKFILDLTRVPITSLHFRNIICQNSTAHPLHRIKDPVYEQKLNSCHKKMELLFQYGFVPSLDDIKYSINCRFEILNIDRFNITLDNEMLKLCRENEFFPSYKFTCISTEMLALQEACKIKDFSAIKRLIKTHDLVPDCVCMEYISKYKENAVLPYLVQAGGKVNLDCIRIRAGNYNNSRFITYLIDYYEQENTKLIDTYQAKIAKLEKLLNDHNVVDKEEKEEVIINNDVPHFEVQPTYNVLLLNISDDSIMEYVRKYKNKRGPNVKLMEFFAIEKSHKVSYNDCKTLLLNKIKSELWTCEHNKALIKIPTCNRSNFGLHNIDDTNVVSFDDIDKLVYLLYINTYEK
jgi:hypothetical protein